MKPAYLALTFCLALLTYACAAPDVQAESSGCSGVAADYGCSAGPAGCAGEPRGRLFTGERRPVRRLLGAIGRVTGQVALAPFRAVGNWNPRFRPSRRFGGCG